METANTSTIVAGRFTTYSDARRGKASLMERHVPEGDVCIFMVNPPGQHATYPIGGDEAADPGARGALGRSAKGAAVGGAVGAGVGLGAAALAPETSAVLLAAATAAAGTYTGSLVGALQGLGEHPGSAPAEEPRKSGVMVAARADDEQTRAAAREALTQAGAADIEITTGTWRSGTWADFDPKVPPALVR